MFEVKKALELYTCQAQSEWKDWMDRVFNERGVYRDPFVGIAGHMSADVESMPPSQEAQALLSAVRNRRRPNRHGWNYKEDFERYLFDVEGNAFDTAEPRFVAAECFRAGSSYFLRHDLRYHDPFHTLMVTIHFMYGINGSNRMLVVTSEDHTTRAWVKIAQAMIKDLVELTAILRS